MNNENEIKRMAKIVEPFITVLCDSKLIAETLSENGIGDKEQAAREFAEKLKEKSIWFCDTNGTSHKVIFIDNIDETLKEFTANADMS